MTSKTPVTEFNKFIWNSVKDITPFQPLSKYKGLTPIIPTQQQPEFENNVTNSPYFVYTWRRRYDDDEFWIGYYEVLYIIYDESDAVLNEIEDSVYRVLRDPDTAPGKVNDYLRTLNSNPEYHFLRVKFDSSNSSDPVEEEGGRNGRIITMLIGAVDKDS